MGVEFKRGPMGLTLIQVSLPPENISGQHWQQVRQNFYWTSSWPLNDPFGRVTIHFVNSLN